MILSENDRAELRWMLISNRRGVGLHYDSIRRFGWLPAADRLVDAGLATRGSSYRGFSGGYGYWITTRGQDALETSGQSVENLPKALESGAAGQD